MPSRVVEGGRGAADRRQWPLIGRGEELGLCSALLARRDSRGVVVTGATGVGKTRLGAEVMQAAEETGYAALNVTGTATGRAIPLGPFSHLLPADADTAATLLQLLRFARAAIGEHAEGRSVALLVDDAHLLDPASALLVQQVVVAREATVIATVRSGEPAPDAVVALWKDHGCEYLELQPLSIEETGLLVESLIGGEVDGQTKHRVWDASRGLPLVVRELVLDGVERHLLVEHAGLWRWRGAMQAGGRLLELIEVRVGRLGDDERAVLETVSLGEPLSWSLLEASEAVAADGLTRRGVLSVERSGRRLEVRLAHPLFGEFVRARMPPTRVRALQRRLAGALEKTGARRSGDLLRFAVWRVESGGTAPATLLLRAALLAERSHDSVLAERMARAAVDAGGGLAAGRAVTGALIAQERFVEAEAILAPLEAEALSDEERTWVALTRARNLLVGLGRGAEAEAALVNAKRLISDPGLRRELELLRCLVLSNSGRPAQASEAASLLVGEAYEDRDFRVRAVGTAAHALVFAGHVEDALALLRRSQPDAEEAEANRVPVLPAEYRAARAAALLFAGHLEEAEVAASEAYAQFVGDRAANVTALMALGCGLVALLRGRLHPAWRWFREASQLLHESDPGGLGLPLTQALAAQALGQAGDPVGAKEAAIAAENARRPGTSSFDPEVFLGRAWAAAAEGALTEAQQSALAASDLAEERGVLTLALRSAHDLVRLGDPSTAAARLTRLADRVQGSLVGACADHAHAIVAGDARGIESAASALTELGALLWAAEAESAAAFAHREAGREASARTAAARARLLLESCGGARTPALAAAGPSEDLTPREREIAALAAGGASNLEIASRLVVSVRTVENHLQHAYRKLGVGNRRELPSVLRIRE